jgi:hypothetical protein
MVSTDTDPRTAPQRVADLAMRGTDGTLWSRITWPAGEIPDEPPPLLALFAGDELGASELRRLCSHTGLVVLSTSTTSLADGVKLIEWAADRSAELDADTEQLHVAGVGAGAGLAASLALFSRDNDWPPIARQVLVHPRPALPPATASLAGVAPATVVGGGRYAERLRRAGVDVEELPLEPAAPVADVLIRALPE